MSRTTTTAATTPGVAATTWWTLPLDLCDIPAKFVT
jgi:hypothetical protein